MITVLVCITTFESSGTSSDSDDYSDSSRSGSAPSLCSFLSKTLVGLEEIKNKNLTN